MRFIRLDAQTGDHGEYWRLAGGYDRNLFDQFESLCRLAGSELTAVYANNAEKAEILDHPDPLIRWYRTLKEQPGVCESSFPAYTDEDDGTKLWIYSGTIHGVAEVAANMCLQLHGTNPIILPVEPTPNIFVRIWHEYGKQIVIGVIVSIISLVIGMAL